MGAYFLRGDPQFDPLFALDVGEPMELCQEGPVNVFSRKWTKGTATLDCNSYKATLPFQPLPKELQ